jgi:hypothetical protein
VADVWERDHAQGWGNVAKGLGIKPGSAEFHRLKKGFVPSYDRWARPIRIDDSLRVDFPDRGRGPNGIAVFEHPGKGNAGKAKGNADHGNSGKSDHGSSGKADHGNVGKAKSGKGNAGKGKGNTDKGKGHGKS